MEQTLIFWIRSEAHKDLQNRRFLVQGQFLHDKEILVGLRPREGKVGYLVITPLQRPDGSIVMVKRGWISREKRNSRTRPESLVQGDTLIETILRRSEPKGMFVPENNPTKGEWYYINVDAMEKAAQVDADHVLLEQVADSSPNLNNYFMSKGIPIGKSPVVELRNTHLEYAITWYSLAAFTSVMFFMLLRRQRATMVASKVKQPIQSYQDALK